MDPPTIHDLDIVAFRLVCFDLYARDSCFWNTHGHPVNMAPPRQNPETFPLGAAFHSVVAGESHNICLKIGVCYP